MKIAYIILAHKYPEQLIRLIERLNTEKTSFIVHVDQKSDKKIYQEVITYAKNKTNIYLCPQQRVYWGNFSQVSTTLNCLGEIFKNQIVCDYIKLLSGQDYPIQSNIHIEKFLQENFGKEFLEFFELPHQAWEEGGEKNGGIDRVNYYYFHLRSRRFRLPIKRRFPCKFKPFAGSSFWCLSRQCAEYIYKFTSTNNSFVNFFRNVNLPDEIFFQTIILNSSFKEQVINNDLTYTDWEWNSPHPVILDKEHFSKLSESSCLFARKFDMTYDLEILNMLDKKYYSEA